jgi:hypothetical protein
MANIDIQQKRGPGIWPWIAGLAVLALIIWGVMEMTNDRTAATDTTAQPAAEQTPVMPPPPGMTTPPGQAAPGAGPGEPGPAPAQTEPGATTGAATGTLTDPATGEPLAPQHDVPAGQQRNW